jgi:hypothetical protein
MVFQAHFDWYRSKPHTASVSIYGKSHFLTYLITLKLFSASHIKSLILPENLYLLKKSPKTFTICMEKESFHSGHCPGNAKIDSC